MANIFKNKKILVTGGTGSIGSGIVRQLLNLGPSVIRIFDINEEGQFYMQEELAHHKNVRFLIGDVRNKERLKLALRDIDVVFHAAAVKHVPLCEYNPFEAVETNIIGTQNVIFSAIDQGVKRVVVISTDKATEPANVMGATKLLAERLAVAASISSHGKNKPLVTSVRFGNVLNSRGSIIPLVIKQIQKGGPVTVTDPKMTRFLISISDAVKLLFVAAEKTIGGEIFVLKMPAFQLIDLIQVLIKEFAPRYGFKESDIRIKYIGRRSGERDHEILVTESESETALELKNMFVLLPKANYPYFDFEYDYKGCKSARRMEINSKQVDKISQYALRQMLKNEGIF